MAAPKLRKINTTKMGGVCGTAVQPMGLRTGLVRLARNKSRVTQFRDRVSHVVVVFE